MLFVQRGRNALIGLHMSGGFSVPSTQPSNSLKYLSSASVHQAKATFRLMFPGGFSNRELFTRVNKCASCFQSPGVVESAGAAETVVVQFFKWFRMCRQELQQHFCWFFHTWTSFFHFCPLRCFLLLHFGCRSSATC